MKIKRKFNQQGFSLIELIATLVIVGILGVGVSAYFAKTTQGFIMARLNNQSYQKMEIALERLLKETKFMDGLIEAGADTLRFTRGGEQFGLARVGNTIRMVRGGNALPTVTTGAILMDDVSGFTLEFQEADGSNWTVHTDHSLNGLSRIRISITIDISDTTRSFEVSVNPLFNNTVNGSAS